MRRRGSLAVLAAVVAVALTGVAAPAEAHTPAAAGNQLWAERHAAAATSYNTGSAIALSPDGGTVYATGFSSGSDGLRSAVVAYGSDGTQLWATRVGGPTQWQTATGSIVVSPDGTRVFAGGFTQATQNESEIIVFAFDAATGARLWTRHYQGRNDYEDWGASLGISPDGNTLFVGGKVAPNITSFEYVTIAYDTATGARRWVSRIGSVTGGVNDLVVSPNGATVFVTGNENAMTIAYDAATGARRWKKVLANPYGWTIGHRITISPDGAHVFVAAAAQSAFATNVTDAMTVAYDAATGHQEWTARYVAPQNRWSQPTGIAVAGDGASVFVTGESTGRYRTIAYDTATGTQRWQSAYTSGERGQDVPAAIAVGPVGVFVTGVSPGPTNTDIATVAYDPATGAQLWASRFVGAAGGDDEGHAIAADPVHSRVYVVGQSWVSDSETDAVTIAYDTAP